MAKPTQEFLSLLGYSQRYGVQIGPFDDGRFPFLSRVGFRIGVPLGIGILTACYDSSRIGTIGDEAHRSLLGEKTGIIYAHWHRYAQFYFFWARRKRHVMMSSIREGGEYGARCMAREGILTVRGSTSSRSRSGKIRDKKGKEALSAMAGLVREEGFHAGLTVDGPKGPALTLKRGAVALARQTGSPILVKTAAARPHVRLFNWDRMWVPLPFSRIIYFFTGPFYIPQEAGGSELEEIRAGIEAHMRKMADAADRYFTESGARERFPWPVWNPSS
jgi:lysophospholipid acyltransferase (LPLAT)-like uncharacterized protein